MGLDGFELKVMDEKESSVTCKDNQRISEFQRNDLVGSLVSLPVLL